MNRSLIRLPWLPLPPTDFGERCKAVASDPDPDRTLRWLASHYLQEAQLARLAKASIATTGAAPRSLTAFRLAVLTNGTPDLLSAPLVASALRHGFRLSTVASPYGQAMRSVLDPASPLYAPAPDAVLLAFDHRGYGFDLEALSDEAEPEGRVEAALEQVDSIRRALRQHSDAQLILQTVPEPVERLFGSFEICVRGTPHGLVSDLNRQLVQSARRNGDVIVDVAGLAHTVGLETWHNPAHWLSHKLSFCPSVLPLYAEHVCRIIGAMRGKSRRCLVLDLDNTLWGGVIGDDGLEGIVLGQGSARGEAFAAVQRTALALSKRGIILAISSKNSESIALDAIRNHPEMLLREDAFAVIQANWSDKATNLEAIAETLNLGLESLVFFDDNPAEREQVRGALPEVAVPELPDNPALYTRILSAAGYFDAINFSDEDRARAADYRANSQRTALLKSARNLDDYLESLRMRAKLAAFDATGRARIVDLINKSNQFNLTTRRYNEAQIAALQTDPCAYTLQLHLADSFGDNGMVSVVICRASGHMWEIDTWLMSCRVLGRGVEKLALNHIAAAALRAGADALRGCYIPTSRNALVRDHYANLGFSAEASDGDATYWLLDLKSFQTPRVPISVIEGGDYRNAE